MVDITAFRHLYPFRSHFLDRNGYCYHYLDEGSGDPLIMVHGNPTWSFYFRHPVTSLSTQYRTVVPDHMGCGLSDKPGEAAYGYRLKDRVRDLEALLDHLGLHENLTLILHDWGGMIGMAFAAAHPERNRRLVITNTAAFLKPAHKALPIRLRLIRDFSRFARPAVLRFNIFAKSALFMATRKGLVPEVKAGLIAPYNCPANRMATLKFVQDIPLGPADPSYELAKRTQDRLGALKQIPMLILWGRHDFVFDIDYFREWQRRFPDAESHLFPEAGHYLFEDEAESTTRLIQHFLSRHSIR